MAQQSANVNQLTRDILDEVFLALGSKVDGWPRKLLWPAFWLPAGRFARLASDFDGIVARSGFQEAARWLLARFTDCKDHFIFSTENAQIRMLALRSALRHLQNGGAVLLFATGLVDPDPSFLPGAEQALLRWSGSLDVFLHKVPETQVLVSIVSGVLAPQCMRHPLVWLKKMEDWQHQRVAEYVQIMQQLAFGRKFGLVPRVTFGKPIPEEALGDGSGSPGGRGATIDYAQQILATHLAWIQSSRPAGHPPH